MRPRAPPSPGARRPRGEAPHGCDRAFDLAEERDEVVEAMQAAAWYAGRACAGTLRRRPPRASTSFGGQVVACYDEETARCEDAPAPTPGLGQCHERMERGHANVGCEHLKPEGTRAVGYEGVDETGRRLGLQHLQLPHRERRGGEVHLCGGRGHVVCRARGSPITSTPAAAGAPANDRPARPGPMMRTVVILSSFRSGPPRGAVRVSVVCQAYQPGAAPEGPWGLSRASRYRQPSGTRLASRSSSGASTNPRSYMRGWGTTSSVSSIRSGRRKGGGVDIERAGSVANGPERARQRPRSRAPLPGASVHVQIALEADETVRNLSWPSGPPRGAVS